MAMRDMCRCLSAENVRVVAIVEVRSQCGSQELAPGLHLPRKNPAEELPSQEISLCRNMAANEKIDALLSWFHANGGYSHPAISVAYNDASGFHVGAHLRLF
jgi:hypothetical protein